MYQWLTILGTIAPMSLSIGIVGLPNVGKSTLFNALLKKQAALAANYPFATIEPNVGIVEVPDERLQVLAQVVKNDFGEKQGDREVPEKIVPATVRFYDIAGLVKDAHKGEGLGNEFLTHIRDVDAIAHVVRDFDDENVIRAGAVEPDTDIGVIETELMMSDLKILEKALDRARDTLKRLGKDANMLFKVDLLERVFDLVNQGKSLRAETFDERELFELRSINLLSIKPQIYVYNISENDVGKYYPLNEQESLKGRVYISAKVESELCSLAEKDAKEYLEALGFANSGLDFLIKAGYSLLQLDSFLTAGKKEVRAWTMKKGSYAPQAAGVIHSDFEKGFIAAQVINYHEILSVMSFKKAKDQGLLRLEGKDYKMKDGDVVEFRFNV